MRKIVMFVLFITMMINTYADDFIMIRSISYRELPRKLQQLHEQYNVVRWDIVPTNKNGDFFHIILEVIEDDKQRY